MRKTSKILLLSLLLPILIVGYVYASAGTWQDTFSDSSTFKDSSYALSADYWRCSENDSQITTQFVSGMVRFTNTLASLDNQTDLFTAYQRTTLSASSDITVETEVTPHGLTLSDDYTVICLLTSAPAYATSINFLGNGSLMFYYGTHANSILAYSNAVTYTILVEFSSLGVVDITINDVVIVNQTATGYTVGEIIKDQLSSGSWHHTTNTAYVSYMDINYFKWNYGSGGSPGSIINDWIPTILSFMMLGIVMGFIKKMT